jgi:hypothetical protein
MKAGFQTNLEVSLKPDSDGIWIIHSPLKYWSKILNCLIVIPYWFESQEPNDEVSFFETDFASVPRVPIIYEMWGNKCHREAVLHDYLFRIDSRPVVGFFRTNCVFLEAMWSRLTEGPGVDIANTETILISSFDLMKRMARAYIIAVPMFLAVCLCGWTSYHKLYVKDKL